LGVPASAPVCEFGPGCWINRPGGKAVVVNEKKTGKVPPLVLIGALYGTPTIPLGSTVVVMTRVLTARVRVCEAVCGGTAESVTLAVKVATPAAPGVPLITPLLLSVNPAGSAPLVIADENGATPPATGNLWLYERPATAVGIVVEVNTSGATDTLMVSVPLVAVLGRTLLSVTCAVKVNVPAVVGEPDRIPSGLSVTPGGSVPAATAHVSVPSPPCCNRSCTYGCDTNPFATEVVVMTRGETAPVL
jgi:hypothetical protein